MTDERPNPIADIDEVQPKSPPKKARKRPPPQPKTIDDFVSFVMGSPPTLTSAEVAEAVGVSVDDTRLFWRALGFADVGHERAFTKADVDALKTLLWMVETGIFTLDEAVEVVRAIGQSTARLTEWENSIISRALIERGTIVDRGVVERDQLGALIRDTRRLKPALERLHTYAWRRQQVAAGMRAVATADEGPDARTDQMTVGFADLVGFTRLTRQLEEQELAEMVETFEAVSSDIVAATGARLIKTLGDEVFFVGKTAQMVAETSLRLHEAHRTTQKFPQMRIGLATGSIVMRMGDVFGTTVNRAARLTDMAKPGSTFIDSATMDELEHSDGYAFRGVRPRRARGFGLLRAWSLQRMAIKP